MIDRNAAWAAAYGAAFDRLLDAIMRADGWPDEVILEAIGDDAKTVADAAVNVLGERSPHASDGWRRIDEDTAFAPPFGTIRKCVSCGSLVAGGPTACARCADGKHESEEHPQQQNRDKSMDVWVWGSTDASHDIYARNYADFIAKRNLLAKHVLNGERYVPHSQLVAAQRDSELLGAILTVYTTSSINELDDFLAQVIADRTR